MLKIQFALTHRVKDLDVQVKYDDIDFEFQNLMGGGLMGNTLNLVINVVGEEIVKTQKSKLVELMKENFHEIISNYL